MNKADSIMKLAFTMVLLYVNLLSALGAYRDHSDAACAFSVLASITLIFVAQHLYNKVANLAEQERNGSFK